MMPPAHPHRQPAIVAVFVSRYQKVPCLFHFQAAEYRDAMVQILAKESIRDTANRINLNKIKLY